METVRSFNFIDERCHEELLLKIPEKAEAAYGMYTWPSAVVLAQYLWYHRKTLGRKHVLELGAGTALPGVLTAKCGNPASVTLTDDIRQPRCLENCRQSCIANDLPYHMIRPRPSQTDVEQKGGTVNIMGLTWGEISPNMLQMGSDSINVQYPDVVLGSDCFFDENTYEKVLFSAHHLLKCRTLNQPCTEPPRFLCTYQVRSAKSTIEDLLLLWGMTCRQISLSSFDADDDDIAESGLPGSHEVQMLEIVLN